MVGGLEVERLSVQHSDWQQCDARDARGRPCTVPDGPWGARHEGPCDFTPVDPVECGCADCRADLREWAATCADPGDEDDGEAKRLAMTLVALGACSIEQAVDFAVLHAPPVPR